MFLYMALSLSPWFCTILPRLQREGEGDGHRAAMTQAAPAAGQHD
jgi:hypothetical protein